MGNHDYFPANVASFEEANTNPYILSIMEVWNLFLDEKAL